MNNKIKLITTPKGGKEGSNRQARLNQLVGVITCQFEGDTASIVSLEDQKGLLTVTHHRRLPKVAKKAIKEVWKEYFHEPNIEFKVNK